jgi:hypothetical protein
MTVGMLRLGWSSLALLCATWLVFAWQTNGQQPSVSGSQSRRAQQQAESQLPWVTMDEIMERIRNSKAPDNTRRTKSNKPTETRTKGIEVRPSSRPGVTKAQAIETQAADATDSEGTGEESAIEQTQPPKTLSNELTPELIELREKLRKALAMYHPRYQNSRDNSPWEVMHAIIAYGVDTQIRKNGPGGEPVNAVGFMCYNYPCKGDQILLLNRGKVEARRGPGVQGHFGQFLAILAQSHVKRDYPMNVGGKMFTLEDLIEHEKQNCFAGEELTFKLIALMHYLDSDETWTNRDGQEWSIQRLVQEELKQPIRGAACGGTHRLMGFSYAVNKRTQRGKPIVGQFERAQKFIQDYHRYTFSLQNSDGSFSTEWFVRRGNTPDIDRRLKTSGHILEWIGFSVSDEELRDPRMIKAADYLASLLLKYDNHKWEIGPLGHGLHALAIYNRRMFNDNQIVWPQDTIAAQAALEEASLQARRPKQSE